MSAYRLKADSEQGSEPLRNVSSAFALRHYLDMLTAKELAEEAVISELVSARFFPVTREKTGKFAIFGFGIAFRLTPPAEPPPENVDATSRVNEP